MYNQIYHEWVPSAARSHVQLSRPQSRVDVRFVAGYAIDETNGGHVENPTLAMHPPARRRIHLLSFGLALVLAAIAMLLLFLASQARAQSLSNLDDLVVTQELLRPTSDDNPTLAAAVAIDDSSPLLLPGQPATIRTRVRNAGSTPLRVTLGLLPQRIEADSTDELSCPPYC